MSVIFEGILVNSSDLEKCGIVSKLEENKLSEIHFDAENSLIYKKDEREFSNTFEDVAVYLSNKLNTALLIRYDSRTSYRSSLLYQEGKKVKEFGEEEELFVPLDEDGEPLVNNQKLRQSEFVPDEEYETITNAIQLGLESFGVDQSKWGKLVDLINNL